MSYRMLEPEEEPRCECFYVEARDEMDREDCPFHHDLYDQPGLGEEWQERRNPPLAITRKVKESAA